MQSSAVVDSKFCGIAEDVLKHSMYMSTWLWLHGFVHALYAQVKGAFGTISGLALVLVQLIFGAKIFRKGAYVMTLT